MMLYIEIRSSKDLLVLLLLLKLKKQQLITDKKKEEEGRRGVGESLSSLRRLLHQL